MVIPYGAKMTGTQFQDYSQGHLPMESNLINMTTEPNEAFFDIALC